jgi:hypothetical protein
MTIVAGAVCPEGVVIAGDSRSSIQLAPGAVRTSTDYARKVFAINGQFVAATFGWATLERKTISGHVRDFELQMAHTDDVGQIAGELRDYFQARIQARGIQDIAQTNNPGGAWNGATDVMTRLVKGFDMARVDVSEWPQPHQDELSQAQYIINFAWFALQDAIDWTVYVARTTIDTQRFTNGTVGVPGAAPTTGGAIEVATVTPGDGVRWINRTDLRG